MIGEKMEENCEKKVSPTGRGTKNGEEKMKWKIIFFLIIIVTLLNIGCLNENEFQCDDLSIVFNPEINITEARNLVEKYNVTIDEIREEPTYVDGNIEMIVVAYVYVNNIEERDIICDQINKEEIVWTCSVDYPDD